MIDLLERMHSCRLCALREGCGGVVVPQDIRAKPLMVVGDFPGSEEDLLCEPFVSREGRLLRKLLDEAGFAEADYHLTLAVKCMPAPYKPPKQREVLWCSAWLTEEVAAVAPRFILALGRLAGSVVLGEPRSALVSEYGGVFRKAACDERIDAAAWFSPAWILQHGKAADRDSVRFFKQVRDKIDEYQAASETGLVGPAPAESRGP